MVYSTDHAVTHLRRPFPICADLGERVTHSGQLIGYRAARCWFDRRAGEVIASHDVKPVGYRTTWRALIGFASAAEQQQDKC